ncbi:MAG: transporter substrate-binding domain-containing protein [Spirochaetaceae bacterium]
MNNIFAETIVISLGIPEGHPVFQGQLIYYEDIASKIPGLDIELVSLPLERCRINLINGKTGGDSARTDFVYADNESIIRVNEPIFTSEYIAYTGARNSNLKGPLDLKKLSIVGIRGDVALMNYQKENNLKILYVNNSEQGFNMVGNGRVDIFIAPRAYIAYLSLDIYKGFNINVIEPPVFFTNMYLFLNIKYQKYAKDFEKIIYEINNP